jgi:hypothetical protein
MTLIGALTVEEIKAFGLTNSDIEAIREFSARYRKSIDDTKRPVTAWDPETSREMLRMAYEQGLTAGIAKARDLAIIKPKIGF